MLQNWQLGERQIRFTTAKQISAEQIFALDRDWAPSNRKQYDSFLQQCETTKALLLFGRAWNRCLRVGAAWGSLKNLEGVGCIEENTVGDGAE